MVTGRPRLPEDARLVRRSIALAPSTWRAVAVAAALAGVSVAEWVRRVVIDTLRRDS